MDMMAWLMCTAGILCMSDDSNKNIDKNPEKRVAKRWAFGSDKQISEFLNWYNTDVMIWTCRNTVKHNWNPNSSSSIELYCEVLGSVTSLDWYRGDDKLKLGSKYKLVAFPHYRKGHYYGKWIDYRLQIADPKPEDTGQYHVVAKGLKGKPETQIIFVDISDKKPEIAAQKSLIATKTNNKGNKVKDLKENKKNKPRNKKAKEARKRKNRRRKNRKRKRGHRRNRGGKRKKNRRNKDRRGRKRGRKHRGQRKHNRRPKSKTIVKIETPKLKSIDKITTLKKLFPILTTPSYRYPIANETNDTIVGA